MARFARAAPQIAPTVASGLISEYLHNVDKYITHWDIIEY